MAADISTWNVLDEALPTIQSINFVGIDVETDDIEPCCTTCEHQRYSDIAEPDDPDDCLAFVDRPQKQIDFVNGTIHQQDPRTPRTYAKSSASTRGSD